MATSPAPARAPESRCFPPPTAAESNAKKARVAVAVVAVSQRSTGTSPDGGEDSLAQNTVLFLDRFLNFSYDAAGQMVGAIDPAATYAFKYDALGRLDWETQAITGHNQSLIAFDSTYDLVGNRTQLATRLGATFTTPPQGASVLSGGAADFVTTATYDGLYRMTSLVQTTQSPNPSGIFGIATTANNVAPKRVDFTYRADSSYDTIQRYSAVTNSGLAAKTAFVYDGTGRVKQIKHSPASGTDLDRHDYSYDAVNRVTSYVSQWDGSRSFSYDADSQLLSASGGTVPTESFAYDANGNRTTGNGRSYQTTTFDNRLVTEGVFSFAYDDEGNVKYKTELGTGKVTEFTWDHRNRLTKLEERSAAGAVTKSVDYVYDALDRRLYKTVDADGWGAQTPASELFVYVGQHVALQYRDLDGTGIQPGQLTHRYLHGPAVDMLLADEQVTPTAQAGPLNPGVVMWALTDMLGSVKTVVDSNGKVREHVSYG